MIFWEELETLLVEEIGEDFTGGMAKKTYQRMKEIRGITKV